METTISSGNLQSLLRLLDDKGMTPQQFTAILSSGILADVCDADAHLDDRNAIRIALKLGTLVPVFFSLMVNYGLSLEAMIAAGHYDWWNNDITAKRFPIIGEGIVEFEARYFNFDPTNISSEDAVSEIETADTKNSWMPAKIEHVLSHGATFPDEQRKFPIIGLGSVAKINGDRRVPCLDKDGSERHLYLNWWSHGWPPVCRFLAVRKVSGS